MQVTFIGSGNVATVLGRRLIQSGHSVRQVYSPNGEHARQLGAELSANGANDLLEIDGEADMYIVALSDKALEEVASIWKMKDKLVVHTAGSVSIEVLKNVSNNYGVLYPLQTIRKELKSSLVLPMLVDGNNTVNKTKIYDFAQSFADRVEYADDAQRSKLHLAAVVSNNFSNYLFALAEDYCKGENVEFSLILPLLEESVKRLYGHSPADVQTGPAIRRDNKTIQRHLQMLAGYGELKGLYEVITEKITESLKLRG